METLQEVIQKVKDGQADRPFLIKVLRKVRMGAIEAGDKKVLEFFTAPIEAIADRLIKENRPA